MKRKWFFTVFYLLIAVALLGIVTVFALDAGSLNWWTVDGGGATSPARVAVTAWLAVSVNPTPEHPLAGLTPWLEASGVVASPVSPSPCPSPWIGGVSITSDKNVVAVGRPHIGAEVASYDGFSAGSLTAYVPMLFKNAYGGSYDFALYIQNVDSALATLSIKYYDSTGTLTCTVSGETIAPLASKGYWLPGLAASCLPDGWIGGAVITSDKNIVANGRPHIGAEVMTYDSFSTGSLTSYLPMLFKNAYGGSYDFAFYVQNVDPANTATLTIKYYDSTGALTCTVTGDTVAPFASKGYWLPGLPLAVCPMVGSVARWSHLINQLSLSVVRMSAHRSPPTTASLLAKVTSYVPMLFKNAFGGSYDAAFYVQNVGATTATLDISIMTWLAI